MCALSNSECPKLPCAVQDPGHLVETDGQEIVEQMGTSTLQFDFFLIQGILYPDGILEHPPNVLCKVSYPRPPNCY